MRGKHFAAELCPQPKEGIVNNVGATGKPFGKNDKISFIPKPTHKNKFQMDHGFKHKTWKQMTSQGLHEICEFYNLDIGKTVPQHPDVVQEKSIHLTEGK